MPVSKLKNLTIFILLMANLALILLVAPNRVQSRQEEEALWESLERLYTEAEITLSPEARADTLSLYQLELKEGGDADLQAAGVLLGDKLLKQEDSTRYLSSYRSDRGTCQISQNGEFQAQLTDQPERGDLKKSAQRTLRSMGFSWASMDEPERVRAGVYELRAVQSVLGVPVFSDGLTLTYSNNRLTALEGTFLTGAKTLTRVSDRACLTAGDALVVFLSARYELGWVGSEVLSMEQGYVLTETAAAATVRLTPVWLLGTDTGSFLVNGISGEVLPAE